jgi:hypothetical protein
MRPRDCSNSVAAVPLFSRIRPVSSFGLSRVKLDQRSRSPQLPSEEYRHYFAQRWRTRMKKAIASLALALALMSSAVRAGERAGDAALGAVSGAVVLGPIGAVAGAVVGYTAGPSISHSWGLHRSSAPRQARRAASPDARVPAGDSQPVPNQSAPKEQAAPQAAAPALPSVTTTASTAPPVQPLE